MNWSSWSEFLSMGGYARYVWGSMAVTVLLIAGEVAQIAIRRRAQRQRFDARANIGEPQP